MYDYTKLTDFELDALSRPCNLADGHARYSLEQSYTYVRDQLPQLLPQVQYQQTAEAQFFDIFFTLSNQKVDNASAYTLYAPSASISIEIVANYLRMHQMSVSLIEPVFDNLADILKRHSIRTEPLNEDYLHQYGLQEWLKTVDTDAIFLVMPNNPTGYVFSKEDFSSILDFCVRENKLLILDFSFRFFTPELLNWNQYALLEQSDVRYIALEDTGKTWPTYELKVSPLITDSSTYKDICSIYRDIFICHSSLALALVGSFIKRSQQQGLSETIWSISQGNRALLKKAITNTNLRSVGYPSTSVEWLHIEDGMNDMDMVGLLQSYGVYVLPGRNFFWSRSRESSQFIRVALMRDSSYFAKGMEKLQQLFRVHTNGEVKVS